VNPFNPDSHPGFIRRGLNPVAYSITSPLADLTASRALQLEFFIPGVGGADFMSNMVRLVRSELKKDI